MSLDAVAAQMAAPQKGILAADESSGTIAKRFESIGLESTEESRRDWRELLLRTSQALEHYISGVILFEETLRQNAQDGTPLRELLCATGALAGIKVDKGAKALAGSPEEKVTEGLDGLRERLQDYHELGAVFAKWRAVIVIGTGLPTRGAIAANAHALARYAAVCQEVGLVPIVEPEVLMDGTHDATRCFEVTEELLHRVYEALYEQKVRLESTVLKPNMVVAGAQCPHQIGVDEVAARTLECLRRSVPAAVPGIAFLSGGQSDELATAHLNAMNALASAPWALTFSYGRALQAHPLRVWGGKDANVSAAQAAFAHRAQMNSLATQGLWTPAKENAA